MESHPMLSRTRKLPGSQMPTKPVRHPIFARFYIRLSAGLEKAGVGELREQLLAGLSGSVIEVGAGNGLNFPHYPPTVTSVLAVEPEPHLRDVAAQQAAKAVVPIRIADGSAEHLPAEDGAYDAVVATLMLCSVPDQAVALREMYRVLRPGGDLRFMEHVAAESAGHRRIQRLCDATIWPVCFGGCHASRDTVAAIAEAGFAVRQVTRYRWPETGHPWPTSPHARGVAIRA
jgi:ubiquinone/menaquinone biosynthesis C-methylase UbiE